MQQQVVQSGFTLRPYQQDFLHNLSIATANHGRVIGCAPTGSGKSKVMISIARNAIARGRTVIIISESRKIFDQLAGESKGHQIKAGLKYISIQPGHLYVAMAQTLARRPRIIEQINALKVAPIVIVDEAHIGTPTKLIRQFTNAMVIGFTATPDARAAKHLPELYKECVVSCQVDDLIQQGFLCSYKHSARTKAGLDALQMSSTGEFSEESQEATFGTTEVYDGIFEDLHKVKFKKCMVFVASIKHCEEMYSNLVAQGFTAVRYHSELENASYELAKFTELDLANICVSVGSLTKGFDFPPIDLVILNRATTSLPLYLQMIGRASRPVPAIGKNFFEVIDYGGNWERHGFYFQDRDWQAMWRQTKKRRKRGEGVAPVKMCDSCEAIIPAGKSVCPYCGHSIPLTEKELQQGEFVEVTARYNDLIGKKISDLTPEELAVYARIKNKKAFAARVARAQEQKHHGWLMAYAEQMGYKSGWIDYQLTLIPEEPIDYADITLK